MSDRTLKLLLVDPDPVFRAGLRLVTEQYPDLQVAAEAETGAAALQILAAPSGKATTSTTSIPLPTVDLVVLELGLSHSQPQHLLGLQLCRQLKTQYPNLPVLLLSSLQESTQLAAARAIGVDGYCPKGTSVSELVAAMRQVAAGRSYWVEVTGNGELFLEQRGRGAEGQRSRGAEEQRRRLLTISPHHPITPSPHPPISPSLLATISDRLRSSGLQQIDATLAEVTARLRIPGLPLLDRAFLAGQRRELLAARWLVNQLLAAPTEAGELLSKGARKQESRGAQRRGKFISPSPPHPRTSAPVSIGSNPSPELAIAQPEASSQLSSRTLQADLFESVLAKLQFSLHNVTDVPLEIDIFREEKKRELLYLILQKIEDVLGELRFSQVQSSQLLEMQSLILRDLWQVATTEFFGKYSTLRVGDRQLELANLLLQDAVVVQTAILDKIPLVVELFDYLLFQTPLVVDNVPHVAGSPKAMARAEVILQNLLIYTANGVVQPLLNRFADVEAIKQSFYDRRLISTREIERFRNNLSWKYRWENYIGEPKAIFESRYDLFVLANRGIAKISIYAPRGQKLAQLSGIQLAVTLALETRDAIAPRLRGAVAFLGSGVVYVLTQVIGRAIGLIGRGFLQGIGGSLPSASRREQGAGSREKGR